MAHPLFSVVGLELEYMIVDRDTLAVRPLADELIKSEVGAYESEIERGEIAWSNELALHVIELKTNGPRPSLRGLATALQAEVRHMDRRLAPLGARLMPGGSHPFMDPLRETRLWPHEYSPVYAAFQRIFDCRGHGWGNVQSVHLNLPFDGPEEFGRLHAAVRFALPLLPALAASTPFADGRPSGYLDTRLEHYRTHAAAIPSVVSAVIPEPVFTPADYQRDILERIYADLAPHDADGTLRHEWVNARGCIARFDRSAIEVRVIDTSECPEVDVAIAAGAQALIRALAEGALVPPDAQRSWPTEALARVYHAAVRDADAALADPDYARALGAPDAPTAGALWRALLASPAVSGHLEPEFAAPLARLLDSGCLARRLLRRVGDPVDPGRLREVYRELCDCLAAGKPFPG